MITIKEAAIKTITNDEVLAKRIAKFCTDNQLVAFINGIPVDLKIQVDKLIEVLNQPNINILKSFITNDGLSVVVDYEYDKIMFKNQDGKISRYQDNDYTKETSVRSRTHIIIDLINCEKYGIEVFFA